MRISDWSSDVCSSDLTGGERRQEHVFGVGQPRVSTQARVVRTVDDRLARRRHAPATIIAAIAARSFAAIAGPLRSEEHTSELQSLMRISYAVFCLKKKQTKTSKNTDTKNIDNKQRT